MTNKQKVLEDQLKYQKRLNSITNGIHSAKDTNDILLELHGDLLGFFDAKRLTIYLVDSAKREIYSKIKTGDEINEIRLPINSGSLSGFCAQAGKLLNIQDVYDDDELKSFDPKLKFDKAWDQRTAYRTKQVLVAAITYNRYLLGVVQLINKKGGERFSQADQSLTRQDQRGGTGLGLAVTKSIIDMHDGHVTFSTVRAPKPAHGTTFTITLPEWNEDNDALPFTH